MSSGIKDIEWIIDEAMKDLQRMKKNIGERLPFSLNDFMEKAEDGEWSPKCFNGILNQMISDTGGDEHGITMLLLYAFAEAVRSGRISSDVMTFEPKGKEDGENFFYNLRTEDDSPQEEVLWLEIVGKEPKKISICGVSFKAETYKKT